MPYLDLELDLNDEQIAIRETVHKFAEEVLRPAGIALDRLADPSEVIAEGSPLWGVFEKHRDIGLARDELLEAEPDPVRRTLTQLLIQEELGWGDAGLAISLGVAGFHRIFARMSGKPALIERFAGPDNSDIGCWAITEPDHGSDTLAFSMKHFSDASLRCNCTATRDGNDWIIRGQKAAWVSNGTISTLATLFVTVNPEHGFAGGGVCLVPLDLPGVSRGKPLDKLGQRPLNQGELFFDDVRLSDEYMVLAEPVYQPALEQVLTFANASMGVIFMGLARAAYEEALRYAKERVQGGTTIFEHQSVKARLFRMFMAVEAARALARRVALHNGTRPAHVQHSIASKVFCTTTAFEVASAALQIHGGNGLSREYRIEKMIRDARAAMIEDGCNELLGLVAAEKL